jgi:hypothetical protein
VNAIARYALFGAFSGALYALWNFGFLDSVDVGDRMIADVLEEISNRGGAGLFYGVIVGAALRRPLGFTPLGWPLYAIAAGISYYMAFSVAVHFHDQNSPAITALAGGIAGMAGALLLNAATAALSPLARTARFFVVTAIAGAVLGLLLPLPLNADSLPGWIGFFAVWQAGYAAATAHALRLT